MIRIPGFLPLRFSLLTLVLITAILCLAVSHVRTSLQLKELTEEFQRLTTEFGYLHVTDLRDLDSVT